MSKSSIISLICCLPLTKTVAANTILVTVFHGRKLIDLLKPDVGIIREGTGHVFMAEEWKWLHDLTDNQIDKVTKLGH